MTIPFDIWSLIASFLPAERRKELYPVNHAFFIIGMNERYKRVEIVVGLEGRKVSRMLDWLQ